MKAICIGGPRHLHEFEIGEAPPPVWYVPVPHDNQYLLQERAMYVTPLNVVFQTTAYHRQPTLVAGRTIYVHEEEQ